MSRMCADSCRYCTEDTDYEEESEIQPASGWNEWGVWSLCDVVCGEGVRYRSRTCRGGSCDGVVTQSSACTVTECPKGTLYSFFYL